jgi:hypothetical protein
MITSKLHEPREGDTLLGDHERAGLKAASVIRSSKIASIETRRILRKIGSIAKADLASVADEICRFVDVGGAKSRRSKK